MFDQCTGSDGEHITSVVFEDSVSERDKQVRYKAFHDAYLCAARAVEHIAATTSKECADAVRDLDLVNTLRRMAAEVKAVALSRR